MGVKSQRGRQEGGHGDQWRMESFRGHRVLRGVTVPRDRHVVGGRILSKLRARCGDFAHPWREWPTRNLPGWREDFRPERGGREIPRPGQSPATEAGDSGQVGLAGCR